MATKRTNTKSAAAKAPAKKKTAPTAKKAPKAEAKPQGPRHPKGRVAEKHQGKAALAKTLASSLAFGDESADSVEGRLKTASNTQLLRLQKLVETVKSKWGSRDKLIAALADHGKKSKDKDYVAKLSSYSLPQLVDLARATH